jgi:predicted nucleotidyltransferase
MFLSEKDQKTLENIISDLKRDNTILAAILYGSALETENYRDIDLALVKKVDASSKSLKFLLSFPEKFDVHFLKDIPIIIAKDAIKGEILFNKEYSELFDIFIEIIREWESFRPYYKIYLEAVKNGL